MASAGCCGPRYGHFEKHSHYRRHAAASDRKGSQLRGEGKNVFPPKCRRRLGWSRTRLRRHAARPSRQLQEIYARNYELHTRRSAQHERHDARRISARDAQLSSDAIAAACLRRRFAFCRLLTIIFLASNSAHISKISNLDLALCVKILRK